MFFTNERARIVTKTNSRGTIKTVTADRDEGSTIVEVYTKDNGNGRPRLFVKLGNGDYMALNGNETRTIYRTLKKHFQNAGRSF